MFRLIESIHSAFVFAWDKLVVWVGPHSFVLAAIALALILLAFVARLLGVA